MQGSGVADASTVTSRVAGGRGGGQRQLAREHATEQLSHADSAGRDRAPAAESPQSKERIVALLFDAFSCRELLGVLPLLHPDVVFQPMTAEVTRAGEPYRGHDGMRRYSEDIESHWDELTVRPAQIRAAGRAVVVLGLASGRGPAGSFENAPTTWVIKFKDGLVSAVQIFSDARHVRGALVGDEQG
jgi:ketosteroid isomerase-like protein